MSGSIRISLQALRMAVNKVSPALENELMHEIMCAAGYPPDPIAPEGPVEGPMTTHTRRKRSGKKAEKKDPAAPAAEPGADGDAAPAERDES